MLCCGRAWQPTKVHRVVETFPTSTRVAKVMTDAGIGFLKGIGNPAGTNSLACELVAAELAVWLGLRTPDFAVLNVGGIEIPLHGGGVVSPGPAFISREVQGTTGTPGDVFLRKLVAPGQVAKLAVFDTWIRNADRCPPEEAPDPTPNYDNQFFTPSGRKFDLVALDHSHCFVETTLDQELGRPHLAADERLYGFFPEFRPYLTDKLVTQALERLSEMHRAFAEEVVGSIPPQWDVTETMRQAWADLIAVRAARVCDFVPRLLGVQGKLEI
jgi:hypothetical protein